MRDFFEIAVLGPMRQLYEQLVLFVPKLLGLFVLFFLGLFLGWLVYRIVRRSLVAVNFDKFCSQLGLATIFEKANIFRPVSELVASGLYWLIVFSFFMIGLRTLDESIMAGVFSRFFSYLPNLVVAIFIFVIGFMFSKFIARSVLIGAVNAQIRSAKLLSISVELLVMIFTLSLALEQLGIGKATIVAAFSIVFGGIVLGLAISFGLGGRHLAQRFLERRIGQRNEKDTEEEERFLHL
jgi:mechanosensitive ion channel-like protein